MKKLMTWNPNGTNNGTLHVMDETGTWKPYQNVVPRHLQKEDVKMKSQFLPLSKGYATMQNLLKLGWTLIDGSKEV
jgi:hypothetical protein